MVGQLRAQIVLWKDWYWFPASKPGGSQLPLTPDLGLSYLWPPTECTQAPHLNGWKERRGERCQDATVFKLSPLTLNTVVRYAEGRTAIIASKKHSRSRQKEAMSETVQYMWSSEYVGTLRNGELPFKVWSVTSEWGEKKEVERTGEKGGEKRHKLRCRRGGASEHGVRSWLGP